MGSMSRTRAAALILGLGLALAEHVRVPADQLEAAPVRDGGQVALPALLEEEREEQDLEEHVAELVQDVTAASNEQAGGVAQINRALTQVDQVTQRNATAAEELAATAEEMAAQAEGLQSLVEFFQLPGSIHAPRTMMPAAVTPHFFPSSYVIGHA